MIFRPLAARVPIANRLSSGWTPTTRPVVLAARRLHGRHSSGGCYNLFETADCPGKNSRSNSCEIRRLPSERRARLTWSDGHVAEFDYDYLRGYCPCAACQGHAAGPVRFHEPAVSVEPADIAPVGNYAIAFAWSDGHGTGIYRFDFLREICPCDACRRARDGEPAS